MLVKGLIAFSMILSAFSQSVPVAFDVSPNYRIHYPVSAAYINRLVSWWGTGLLQAVGVPGYAIEPIGYNIFIYTFYLCQSGSAVDVASFWQNAGNYGLPPSFGQTPSQIQMSIINLYHGRNIMLGLSSFGSTENPTTLNINPTSCGNSFAKHVLANHYDLVDSDYEDSAAFQAGTAEAWVVTYQTQISRILPQHIIAHAPQAPYFINNVARYPKGAYLYLEKTIGNLIDLYLTQFYNQGSTTYDNYHLLFQASGGVFPGTSVFEMVANGIPSNKIVVGKPPTPADVYNTGIVSAQDLQTFFNRAYDEKHWYGGLMIWQYASDTASSFGNTVLQGLRSRCARDLNCF